MVNTLCLFTSPTEVMQDATHWPLTITVQARHWPSPQPNFVPVKCKSSRSTSSNGRSGAVVRVCNFPFKIKLISASISSSQKRLTTHNNNELSAHSGQRGKKNHLISTL